MFENQTEEQVVEEVLDKPENTDVEKTSAKEAPAAKVEIVTEIKNYLNPELFQDVRVVDKNELEHDNKSGSDEVNTELENLYSKTFGDISEHSLIKGRVVGMNERDVLIDIGFKSEGIIDRSEFNEDELPAIGDQVEVYLEFIEDASGNTILSKEKADFMRRWKELHDAFENETIITGTIVRRI